MKRFQIATIVIGIIYTTGLLFTTDDLASTAIAFLWGVAIMISIVNLVEKNGHK